MHSCNPSAQEAEVGGLWIRGQPRLWSRHCLRKPRALKSACPTSGTLWSAVWRSFALQLSLLGLLVIGNKEFFHVHWIFRHSHPFCVFFSRLCEKDLTAPLFFLAVFLSFKPQRPYLPSLCFHAALLSRSTFIWYVLTFGAHLSWAGLCWFVPRWWVYSGAGRVPHALGCRRNLLKEWTCEYLSLVCCSTVSDLHFHVISQSRMATEFPDIASVFRLQEGKIRGGNMCQSWHCSSVKCAKHVWGFGFKSQHSKKKSVSTFFC